MSRISIPLKSRVRYEGLAHTFDHRAQPGSQLDQLDRLPDPIIWHTLNLTVRKNGPARSKSK